MQRDLRRGGGGGEGLKSNGSMGMTFTTNIIGFFVKMTLFYLDFRNVLHLKFIEESEEAAEHLYFNFRGQYVRPMQRFSSYKPKFAVIFCHT